MAGLRERKKQKTRESIQRAALRLFEKQGYEATTIEQIAAAAEISPSTFFNYFPTKEDAVLFDAYDPVAMNVSLREMIQGLAAAFERDERMLLARARFFLEVPELRARLWDEAERTQELLLELLAERSGRRPDDYELRVTARVVSAALFEASKEWLRSKGRHGLAGLAKRALDIVESGASLSPRTPKSPSPSRGGRDDGSPRVSRARKARRS